MLITGIYSTADTKLPRAREINLLKQLEVPEILVDFVPDFKKLESAVDQMAESGMITKEFAAQFKDAQKPVDALAGTITKAAGGMKKDLSSVSVSAKGIGKSMKEGFDAGTTQKIKITAAELKKMGLTLEQYLAQLKEKEKQDKKDEQQDKKLTASKKGLRTEVKELTEQLSRLKLEGKENTLQYQELSEKAGQYRDTMTDVATEIRKVGSDTRQLDTAIEFASGIAASFAVAQGAIALFGSENEELQKTMLKVQAAMSLLIGLQQIQNLLQKESNLIMAIANKQRKLQVTITQLETAATSKNVIVKGAATVAMRALNAVMKASPAFLLVGVFTAVAGAIAFFTSRTNDAEEAAESYGRELENLRNNLQAFENIIASTEDIELKKLELRGAKESEMQKVRIANMKKIRDQTSADIDAQEKIQNDLISNTSKKGKEQFAEALKLGDELSQKRAKLNSDIQAGEIQLQINIRDEQKEAFEKQQELAKKSAEEREKIREEERQQILAGLRRQLLDVEAGSDAELVLRKQLAIKEGLFEIEKQKLVGERRKEAQRQIQKELEKLDKEQNDNRIKTALENEQSILNAQLSALNISADEKEEATIQLLNIQRELELSQVVNNKTKEKEINAKFDKEIYEQRAAIRKEALDKELADAETGSHIKRAQLQALRDDVDAEFRLRVEALSELEQIELSAIIKRRAAAQKDLQDKVIDLATYNDIVKKIANDEFDIRADFQKQLTALTKSEEQARLEAFQKTVNDVITNIGLMVDAVTAIFNTIAENENTRLQDRRREIDILRENNVITQKEAEQRIKQVERAEREAKRKQAAREKDLALFNAFVQGAQAVIEAAPDPFRIAFTVALVAAQIGAIFRRQIPKFGKGTEKAPRGFGEVGETGTELIQTDKGYYLAEFPQVIWFKGGEKVYNPSETSAMINDVPRANMTVINNNGSSSGEKLNYRQMAKEIGAEIAKHPKHILNIDEHGFTNHVTQQSNVTRYLNKRYTFYD